MKKCRKCGKIKPFSEFNKDYSGKNGYRNYCGACCLKNNKEYEKKNREKRREYRREYRERNKEKIREYNKKYNKEYEKKNREKRREYNKKYQEKNKDKIREQRKEYYKKRKTDIEFKIRRNISGRIRVSIIKGHKKSSSIDLLGCSIKKIRQHLENQFREGMSWDNYGIYGWHIDHIIPCASFDLTKEEEQRRCFHYTNLQPLWAEENLEKGAS